MDWSNTPKPTRAIPDELADAQPLRRRKGSLLQMVVAVIVACALVIGGVLVTVAALTGPAVHADEPLDPVTPASSLPMDMAAGMRAPSLDGTTFIIPVEEENPLAYFELDIHNAYVYDQESQSIPTEKIRRVMGGFSPAGESRVSPHLVVEATLTNNSDKVIVPDVGAGYLLAHFQSFLRTSDGRLSREVAKVGGKPLTYFSYFSPKPLNPYEAHQFVMVLPFERGVKPEQLGIASKGMWSDQAAWLDMKNLLSDGPKF